MAEKQIVVRLRALVDDYKRGMADAAKATDGVTDQGRWKALGQSTAAAGDSLTRNVTLPLVAVGAAATVLATNFDSAFTRMQGLAGVSAAEVDGLKESVLGLAGETGKAPQELAEALYTLRSSGLDGAQAMDALEMSAKASAAGLGNTASIADAVSSAMNAYARSGLSAAEATDVLVATARAGKAEPEELAAAMGRILPVSSQLGISFDEVGGSLAALSLSGNDANASSTLLTNVMSKLLKPSEQAADALSDVGLSVAEVQAMIRERGLLGTLEELRERLGDNGFVRFLEDQQAVQGALALTGDNLQSTQRILDQVSDAAGATDQAFSTWAESMGAKNAKAWAEFQTALIRLGDTIAPIAAQVASAVGAIAGAFDRLPDGVQEAAVYAGLFVAALGPVMSVGGRVVSLLSGMHTVAQKAAAGLGGLRSSAALLAGPAGLLAVGVALDQYNRQQQQMNIGRLANEFLAAGTSAREMDEVLRSAAKLGVRELIGAFEELARTDPVAAERFVDRLEAAGAPDGAIEQMRHGLETLSAAEAQAGADASAAGDAFAGQATDLEGAAGAVQSYSDALRAQFDPLFAVTSANASLAEANQAVNDAVAEFGAQSPQAVAAHLAAAEAAARQQGALGELATAVRDGSLSVDEAVAKLNDWVAQGIISQESANLTALAFYGYADAANSVPDAVNTTVTADTTEGYTKIIQVRDALGEIKDKTITIGVTTALGGNAVALIENKLLRAGGGPVTAGQPYIVGEKGPEWFVPDASGQVLPTGQTPWMSSHMTPAAQPVRVMVDHRSDDPRGVEIGTVNVQTPDSPRQWLDELPWRLARN